MPLSSTANSSSSENAGQEEVVMLKVETLAPERRRPSTISFEKHNLFLADHLGDDFFFSDSDDDNDDDENDELINDKIAVPTRRCLSSHVRQMSDASIDLNELAAFQDAGRRPQGSSIGSSSSRRWRSSVTSSLFSVMEEIEDDIIAKAIDDGKIVASNHESWSSPGDNVFSSSSRRFFSFSASFHSDRSGGRTHNDERRRATSGSKKDDDEDRMELSQHSGDEGSSTAPEIVPVRSPPLRGTMPSQSSFKRSR